MQDKQKVTLYLSPGLHRQLKVRAAVDAEPMSSIVERAIVFYLNHSELVDEVEASPYGRTYQVHACPECSTSVVLRDGKLVGLGDQPGLLPDASNAGIQGVVSSSEANTTSSSGEALVPC